MITLCDILLGSGADEFYQVTRAQDIPGAAGQLIARGAKTVIARDGKNPILILGDGPARYVPVKPVKPVSTLGAGDCFDAMFLSRIASGDPLTEAVRKASDYAGEYISKPRE